MTVADTFQLLGHGNGWPSRGFVSNYSAGSSSPDVGNTISVRPYVQPSSSNDYTATGFLRFRTLGGYSDSNSGAPTQAQLNSSLANAMKFFYNTEKAGSASASASLGNVQGSNTSASVSPSVLKNRNTTSGQEAALSPKERVISFIKELDADGNRLHNVISNSLVGESDSQIFLANSTPAHDDVVSHSTSGPYTVEIVKLFDTTNTNNPVFLGYGLGSQIVSTSEAADSLFESNTESGIGSYFNPDSRIFENSDLGLDQVIKYDISNTSVSGIPLLTLNQVITDDHNGGNSTTSSATSSSATFDMFDGDFVGSSSISPSYDFYTY
jgi:hypothetical protein